MARTQTEYREVRIAALKRGRDQWGHDGRHHGHYTKKQIEAGAPNCPIPLHHHHDDFCELPALGECVAAGVEYRKRWASRA